MQPVTRHEPATRKIDNKLELEKIKCAVQTLIGSMRKKDQPLFLIEVGKLYVESVKH